MSARGLEVGSTLGKYQILSRLGQGGMATVYKAFQPSLEREVALKVLRAGFTEDEEFLDRFRREAKAIAHLRHAHIVQVFDFEEVDGRAFMAMEYLDGGTLKEHMAQLAKSGRRLSQDEVVNIVSQVADALAYAHRLGIVHRDIKPSNVMLLSDGRAVVTDFGIAKVLSGTQHTQTGVGVGTPEYMSPEQGEGKGVDQRADIYSLGVMTYEMFAGRVPFTADTPLAIVLAHIRDPLPLPSEIEPSVGPATERVLLKALAKDADQRYESARAFADALRAGVAEDEGDGSTPTIFVAPPAAAAAATAAPRAGARALAGAAAASGAPAAAATVAAPASFSALLLQRPALVAGTGVALVAVLVIGGVLAFARGPAASPTVAGGAQGATAAPVLSPSPNATPSAATGTIPLRGPLLYEAKLDAAGSEIQRGGGGPDAPAALNFIRTLDGAVQFAIPAADQNVGSSGSGPLPLGIGWRRSFPATFFSEMDVEVTPGSQLELRWFLRRLAQATVALALSTGNESMQVLYVSQPAGPGQFVEPETIGTPVRVSGSASGDKVTIGVAVQPDGRFVMFFNGQYVGQAADARATSAAASADGRNPKVLSINVHGQSGTLTLTGFRVYQLATP
jgi:tRNA A-37 threonylcarbamoyl transferase component Bud32